MCDCTGGCQACKKAPKGPDTRPQKRFIVIASGPSLTAEDCNIAQESGEEIIVVNDCYRICPGADILYACDERWWQYWIADVKANFKGQRMMKVRDANEKAFCHQHGLIPVEGADGKGLGRDKLHFGCNSGYQAMNLAYLKAQQEGVTPQLILLGFDMQKNGKAHWFGDHPAGMVNGNYTSYIQYFNYLAKDLADEGVDVINCTRESALHQFRREPLEAVL